MYNKRKRSLCTIRWGPRLVCAFTKSDQGLHCLLTKPLNTIENIEDLDQTSRLRRIIFAVHVWPKVLLLASSVTLIVNSPDQMLTSINAWLYVALDKVLVQLKMLIIFLFLRENICCGNSYESPQQGHSKVHPLHMISRINETNINMKCPLIKGYTDSPRETLCIINCFNSCLIWNINIAIL